jgi:DNA-binding MarR family transcriptional regulator
MLYIHFMRPLDPVSGPDVHATRVAGACLLMRTRRLSRILTRIYVEHLGAFGLSVSEYTLLAAIGANPGARATDLSSALDLEKSTLSRELKRLSEDDLIEVTSAEGRAQALALTGAGAARLAEAMPAWEAAQAAAIAELGPLADALLGHFHRA